MAWVLRGWPWVGALLLLTLAPAAALADVGASGRGACLDPHTPADSAIAACTTILQVGQMPPADQAVVLVARGNAYRRKPDVARARADFDAAIGLTPSAPAAYGARARLYAAARDFEHALMDVNEALRNDEHNADLLLLRGEVRFSMRDSSGAFADVSAALSANPRLQEALLLRASFYQLRRESSLALRDLNLALQINPRSADALHQRAQVRIMMHDHAAALEDINAALLINSRRQQSLGLRAELETEQGDYDSALTDLESALAIVPNLPALLYDRCLAQIYRRQDIDLAVTQCQSAADAAPTRPLLRAYVATAHYLRHDYAEAITGFDAALAAVSDGDGAARWDRALAQYGRGAARIGLGHTLEGRADEQEATRIRYPATLDFLILTSDSPAPTRRNMLRCMRNQGAERLAGCNAAIASPALSTTLRVAALLARSFAHGADAPQLALADANEAVRLAPQSAIALVSRANVLERQGDSQASLRDADAALRLEPGRPDALEVRGAVLMELGRDDNAALAALQAAVAADPQASTAIMNRGIVHRRLHRDEEAIADFSAAIGLDPSLAGAYVDRALAYQAHDRLDEAEADLTRAIALQPDLLAAYYNRALLYQRRHDYTRAEADLDTVARTDPDYQRLAVFRASLRLSQHHYAEALEGLNEALRRHPQEADLLNQRCWTRALQGQQLDQALTDCNASLQVRPGDAQTLDSRATVYLKLGNFDAALADFEAVLAASPTVWHSLYGRGFIRSRRGQTATGRADMAAALAHDPSYEAEFAGFTSASMH
jgi:tetratricopeptide (TPR) repeat protein